VASGIPRAKLSFVLLLCLCAVAAVASVPGVLIVQIHPEGRTSGAVSVPVADLLAEQLDSAGRVRSVVWSMVDPEFRRAVQTGRVRQPDGPPTLQEVLVGRSVFQCEYIAIVVAFQEGPELKARVELLRADRSMWVDPPARTQRQQGEERTRLIDAADGNFRRVAIMLSGRFDAFESARSLARTWAELMVLGPFKSLPVRPKVETPAAEPGQVTRLAIEEVPKVVDNERFLADMNALVAEGKQARAVVLARDGIDVQPLDPVRRRTLIDLLLSMQRPVLAASEARHAARLVQEQVEFRLLAGRAWLDADRPDEALEDLNEAMARRPDHPDARLMLAEASLLLADPATAIRHLEPLLSSPDAPRAVFLSALAYADLGALERVAALTWKTSPQQFRLAFRLSGSLFDRTASEVRDLLQVAAIGRRDQEAGEASSEALAKLRAHIRLLEGIDVPLSTIAHGRSLLALKLLAQSLTDVQAFLRIRDDELLVEARINLGEASKQMASAREALASEAKPTDADERPSVP
jgi:tetratricopeptide (TPR) repeat protein